jgi:hypothetical protein
MYGFLTVCFSHSACTGRGIFYNWNVSHGLRILYVPHVVSGYKNVLHSYYILYGALFHQLVK